MLSRVHSNWNLLCHDGLALALTSIASLWVGTHSNTSYGQLALTSFSLRLIAGCYKSYWHLRLHSLLSRIVLNGLLSKVLQ